MCTLFEGPAFDAPALQHALERTNHLLEDEGLYLTHIFDENGLVHTRAWVNRLVAPPPGASVFQNFADDAVSAEDIILISKDAIDPLVLDVLVPPVWQEAWQTGIRGWQKASAQACGQASGGGVENGFAKPAVKAAAPNALDAESAPEAR